MRLHRALLAAGLAALAFGLSPSSSGQDMSSGITVPVVFPPFDPAVPRCAAPQGLTRSLVFFQDNDRQFMQGVSFGISEAASARDLDYSVSLADNDPARMIEQVDVAIAARVGAVIAAPIDAMGLAPSLQRVMATGAYVGAVVPPPAITILNAPQYLTGQTLAEAAARYIAADLGGRANVVLLTHDSLEFLAPRFTAMRDVLSAMPGVTIVADISPSPVSKAGGKATMETILLANTSIDVVLGADAVVLGALEALREAGQDRPQQFLGGIDGELEAVDELRQPTSPFKATVSLPSPIFGYALGQFAADWLEGVSVPQAMDILPTLLTRENLPAYEVDIADPASVFRDLSRRENYLNLYGNICYDTRDQYVNFPWSSDARS